MKVESIGGFFCRLLFLLAGAITTPIALAAPLDGLELHWENTVDLSGRYGLHDASLAAGGYCALQSLQALTFNVSDEGSCAYSGGLHSARADFLSQLDVDYGALGLHASAAAWYDAVDNKENASAENHSLRTADSSEHGGRDIELFEAFLHGVTEIGDERPLSFRLGRHSIVWGESLFFDSNGIAAGLAPIDSYMVQNITDYRSRNVYLPVNQISLAWAVLNDLSIEAYDQFEWRRSRIDPQYAYIDPNNVLGAEGARSIALSVPGRGTFYYDRTPDHLPNSSDQYGVALKWHRGDFDIGLYGLSYDSKTPNIYFYPNLFSGSSLSAPGTYRLDYARGIEIYGASVTGPLGNAVFAGEISGRRNMPLVNGGIFILPPSSAQTQPSNRQLFPMGDTLHAQFSWAYTVPPFAGLPDGASWKGEVAANHLVRATANPGQLSAGRTRTAAAIRTVFEPQFLQVLPRIDITLPISAGYNFLGISETDPAMNRGTGDVSFGVTATIDRTWKSAFTFTHYMGKSKYPVTGLSGNQQPLEDWDYIELSVERSF